METILQASGVTVGAFEEEFVAEGKAVGVGEPVDEVNFFI